MMPHEEVGIGQFITILKIRKKSFLVSALAVLVVAILVAGLLPSIYESSSTILIEEQQIPQDFVRSTVTGFADQRIQSLTQQILSRIKLWEIINQFNLYPDLREKLAREEITEKMRDDIKLETISAEIADKKGGRRPTQTTSVTIAFSIAYRGKNPDMVQKPALFMRGLRGVFPGFVLGAKKATRVLREGGRSLEGSCFDKNAARDGLRVDFGRTYPQG